jgi:hypothetical protein
MTVAASEAYLCPTWLDRNIKTKPAKQYTKCYQIRYKRDACTCLGKSEQATISDKELQLLIEVLAQ